MKNKILVLENVRSLDQEIRGYLDKRHKSDDVKIIYNLLDKSTEKQAELLPLLAWCNMIVLQTTFFDRTQLKTFIELLPTFKNIKDIKIIFSYNNPADNNQFLRFLNFEIPKPLMAGVVKLMETIKVSEILCKVVNIAKQEYFNKQEVLFDVVPLYYKKSIDLIWHEFQPVIDRNGERHYKTIKLVGTKTVKITEDKNIKHKDIKIDGLIINIDKNDIPTLKELMGEVRAVFEYQKESCESQDFGDSKKLIAEKKQWLKILDKYKL